MSIRTKGPRGICNRTLFNNAKSKFAFKTEKDGSFHHEYSIRPDTFAFKVSSENINDAAQATKDVNLHPLQKIRQKGFHPVDFLYRNATNYPFDTKSPSQVYDEYPTTNASKLSRSKHRPKKVKMTVSDFIGDSLYNPSYGYFSKGLEIFHTDKPFDYNSLEGVDQFLEVWQKSYDKYGSLQEPKELSKEITKMTKPEQFDSRIAKYAKNIQKQDLAYEKQKTELRKTQLWHTPTELFQPYYGEALARYILFNYKSNGTYPYNDLVIYEMGGGNGTLMCNILNFIKRADPEVYSRTQYNIIEISSHLAFKQKESAFQSKLSQQNLDLDKIKIINKSIFDWDTYIEEACFFIAFEVFDNFPHQLIRYDNSTGVPFEGRVLIDKNGDFFEFFSPELSYYSDAYLNLRENGRYSVLRESETWQGKAQALNSLNPFAGFVHPLLQSSRLLKTKNSLLPLKNGLTPGEFIPTSLLEFFQILNHRFPNHSLICSDFHELPNKIKGYYNAPVVQTVLKDRMVDVSTYMCLQGYFDIMFATDFKIASELYTKVTNKLAKVETHRFFLEQWADLDVTTTQGGENPMLDFYKNVSFMVS